MLCRSTDFLTLRCGMFSTRFLRSGAAFICVDIKVSVTFLGQHTSYKGTLYFTEREGSCLCRKYIHCPMSQLAHCPTRLHVIIVYHFQERKYQIQHTCTFLARVMVWFRATHSYPSRQRDKHCCITQVESSCQISVHCTARDKVVSQF